MEKDIVLISNVDYTLVINVGSSEDKVSRRKGTKMYLNEREADYVRFNYGESLENGLFYFQGEEVELNEAKINNTALSTSEKEEFFELNTNTAKAKVRKMTDLKAIDELIEYANNEEIESKIVDALVKRYNELSD